MTSETASNADETRVKLEAYREAAAQARNYENLSRSEWMLFFPSAGGILGFILIGAFQKPPAIGFAASLVGVIFGCASIFKMLRIRRLYGRFAKKVDELEEELNIDVNRSVGEEIKGGILTNKTVPILLAAVIASVFLISTLYFFVLLVTGKYVPALGVLLS